jgi:outer membrane protein TolC
MLPKNALPFPAVSLCLATLTLACCTPGMMRKSADREVVGLLKAKSSGVPNAGSGLLDITPPPPVSLEELRRSNDTAEFLGDRSYLEKNAKVIPLHEALSLAVRHNRDYQSRKELLYLQALDLTFVRNEFTPIFNGTGAATVTKTQTPGTQTVQVPNPAYTQGGGTPAVPQFLEKQITTLVTDNTLTAQGNLGVSVLTRTGARLAADFTTDFLKFLSGNMTSAGDSTLALTLTQPLLRGAGYRATMETLTQAERDLLYAIRDFTQYRKTFAVDVTSRYYRTLEARDAAKNAFLAYKAFETILTSERALAKEDRRTSSQLGLIEQASLRYKRIWISSVRTYESLLDDLKLTLAIPVETPVVLEDQELAKLTLEEPDFSIEESLHTALITRLDLYNARNSVEDSERKIKVAAQDLLPQLDLSGRYQIDGDPGSRKVNLNMDRRSLAGGLDLDLRLDKKADRNAYRSAMIDQQRTARELDLAEENVRATLRTAWRDLDTARKQYDIASTGVALSLRRVEEEELLRTLGRGTARDLIDAQQDLIEAKDDLTSALIAHTLDRLRLWKDMGVLYIKKDGTWIRVLKNEAEVAGDD